MGAPSTGENGLRRALRAEANPRKFERCSGGQPAYVRVDGWSPQGLAELPRAVYGNTIVNGRSVDDRRNGDWIFADAAVDMLNRKPWYDHARRRGDDLGVPQHLADGPRVLITHEANFSAAETLAPRFRQRMVGTIVGCRTGGAAAGHRHSPTCGSATRRTPRAP